MIWRDSALPLLSFLKRLIGDRRTEPDRRGDDRLEAFQRREGTKRRNHDRRVIYSNAPRGELTLLDGTGLLATLWDISQNGVCVLVPGSVTALNPHELCSLTLREDSDGEEVTLELEVAWSAVEDEGTYIGLKLRAGGTIPVDTFLNRLQQLD